MGQVTMAGIIIRETFKSILMVNNYEIEQLINKITHHKKFLTIQPNKQPAK